MTIIIVGSSIYFKKYAKLPGFISPLIYFYQSTFGYYLHPIIFYSVCAGISFLITAETRGNVFFPRFLGLSIASVICIFFFFFFMSIFTSQTLVFRPISLASTVSEPQYFIIILTILINIFFNIAISLSKKYKIVFLILNIIIYIVSSFSVFFRGGFIDYFVSNIVLSSYITGAVFTTLDLILIILDKNGTIAILFVFIFFYVLLIVLNFFIIRSYNIKQLNLLDLIKEDPAYFSYVTSINKFLQLATCGIKNAHPIILDLSFLRMGIEKWPKK